MGAAAAFIMPSTLSILVNIFPPHERATAIAIWAASSAAPGAIGPVASGWLLGHFWYGSVFLVNVPIILHRARRSGSSSSRSRGIPKRRELDPIGAVLSIIGISSLVYGLIQAPDKGWGERADTRCVRGRASSCSSSFVLWEMHTDEPMLDMKYFRNPGVQHRHRRHGARLPRDVRRDVPHHAVLPAGARATARWALRCASCRCRRS